MKIKTIQMISVKDWDELVVKTYGRPYKFQQQDGCKSRGTFDFKVPSDYAEEDFPNDTVPEKVNGEKMGVAFDAWLARDPKQKLKDQKYNHELHLFWTRNFYPSFDMVAKDLHQKGLLPAGEYTINIDW